VLIASGLAIDAVEECVHEDIAAGEAELGEKSLRAMAGGADQDAADDRFMPGRILPDAEHARGAIQAALMKDRSPLSPESVEGISRRVGCLVAQRQERLAGVTGIEGQRHLGLLLAAWLQRAPLVTVLIIPLLLGFLDMVSCNLFQKAHFGDLHHSMTATGGG